ncbi:MAG: DUF2971 domain-containing protein [Micrococcales bacterium]|nr:DUF2971 domain-containing protein [Micrococcales bacterium]
MSIAAAFPDERWIYDLVLPPAVDDRLVWHYTNVEGLLGILGGHAFHATSVLMLNDSVEFRHGVSLIEEQWATTAAHYSHAPAMDALLRTAAAVLPLQNLFVVCSSTGEKSLSQFRAYGSYAVGINPGMRLRARLPAGGSPDAVGRNIDEIYANTAFDDGWRQVLYSDSEKREHITRLFDALDRLCDGWPSDDDTIGRAHALAQVWYNQAVAYMKHEAFADEREVRLTGNLPSYSPAVQLRSARLGIAPFVQVETMPTPGMRANLLAPIREVRLGPGLADPPAALAGVQYAAQKLGYNIEVNTIDTPLR